MNSATLLLKDQEHDFHMKGCTRFRCEKQDMEQLQRRRGGRDEPYLAMNIAWIMGVDPKFQYMEQLSRVHESDFPVTVKS